MALDIHVVHSIRCISRIACAVLIGAISVLPAEAQSSAKPDQKMSSSTARAELLDVVVSARNGVVVPNASVRLMNQSTNAKILQRTDGRGLVRFLEIPAATYTVEVEAVGFGAVKQTNVKLLVGQAYGIEVCLFVREERIQGPMGVVIRRQYSIPLSEMMRPLLPLEPLPPPQQTERGRNNP